MNDPHPVLRTPLAAVNDPLKLRSSVYLILGLRKAWESIWRVSAAKSVGRFQRV